MLVSMERAILLQIAGITKAKDGILRKFVGDATAEFNRLYDERNFCNRFMDFHRKVYEPTKQRTDVGVQVICELERAVWRSKGKARAITVKFNVPRNCKTFETKSMFFVELGIYPRNRMAVPITKNRNFQRYSDLLKNGWTCKTYGLTPDLQIVAYLSKDAVKLPQRRNVLGIDFNAKRIAVSVLSTEGKVLYQTYFGEHIWLKRKKIMERRSAMQSANNISALRNLRTCERNFVDTNIGQAVHEIINLAIKYDADIAIEKLKRFKPKGKKFNKQVMRMPFRKFREILASRCFDNSITLNAVDPWYTSKFCSHCGAVASNGHSSGNYALFRCKECGVVVNSDRNASKNVALKCLLERGIHTNHIIPQISNWGGLVNDLVMSYEVGLPNVAVQHANQLMESPLR